MWFDNYLYRKQFDMDKKVIKINEAKIREMVAEGLKEALSESLQRPDKIHISYSVKRFWINLSLKNKSMWGNCLSISSIKDAEAKYAEFKSEYKKIYDAKGSVIEKLVFCATKVAFGRCERYGLSSIVWDAQVKVKIGKNEAIVLNAADLKKYFNYEKDDDTMEINDTNVNDYMS